MADAPDEPDSKTPPDSIGDDEAAADPNPGGPSTVNVFIDFESSIPDTPFTRSQSEAIERQRCEDRIAEVLERRQRLPALLLLHPHEEYLNLLLEARALFEQGQFYPCVAMCGIVGERLIKDALRATVRIDTGDGVIHRPSDKAFEQLEYVPVATLVQFLERVAVVDRPTARAAKKLGELRNKYAHARGPEPERDAAEAIELLHVLVEGTVSAFKDHEIRDGILVRRQVPTGQRQHAEERSPAEILEDLAWSRLRDAGKEKLLDFAQKLRTAADAPARSESTRLPKSASADARAKIDRARTHVEALKAEIVAFFGAHTYGVRVERDMDHSRYVIKADHPPVAPVERWGLIAGEAIHALRCALDYLAWQLAGCPAHNRTVQFPICKSKKAFAKDSEQRLSTLGVDALAFLERLQPYAYPGCDKWLSEMSALNNADKHRLLTVATVSRGKITVHFESTGNDLITCESAVDFVDDVVLEDGAVLATLTVPSSYPEMKVDASVTGDVAFGERLDRPLRMFLRPILPVMIDQVEEIVTDFERRFCVL